MSTRTQVPLVINLFVLYKQRPTTKQNKTSQNEQDTYMVSKVMTRLKNPRTNTTKMSYFCDLESINLKVG